MPPSDPPSAPVSCRSGRSSHLLAAHLSLLCPAPWPRLSRERSTQVRARRGGCWDSETPPSLPLRGDQSRAGRARGRGTFREGPSANRGHGFPGTAPASPRDTGRCGDEGSPPGGASWSWCLSACAPWRLSAFPGFQLLPAGPWREETRGTGPRGGTSGPPAAGFDGDGARGGRRLAVGTVGGFKSEEWKDWDCWDEN